MVLLVHEVDLVLHLLEITLICLLLILLRKLVYVLATLVELAKAEDLAISDLYGIVQT